MIDMEDELHRKALDQVAHLLASYEAGLIGPEAFKVGVETVWACLGGIVRKEDFELLMMEANREVADLPSPVHVQFYQSAKNFVVVARTKERSHVIAAPGVAQVKVNTFDMEDEAVAHLRKTKTALQARGFEEIHL